MAEKIKATVDGEILATLAPAHDEVSKMTDAQLATFAAERGAQSTTIGVYTLHMSGAWQLGANAKKAKRNAPDYTPVYDAWFKGKYDRDRKPAEGDKKAERAGDISAFNAWAEAAHDGRDWMKEQADKVFALANVAIQTRARFLRQIVALKAAPTEKWWADNVPNAAGGGQGGGTLKSKTSAMARAVDGLLDVDVPEELADDFLAIRNAVIAFKAEVDAIKAVKAGGSADEKASARAAKLAALKAAASDARKPDAPAIKLDS